MFRKLWAIISIAYKNYSVYIHDLVGVNITYILRLIVIIFMYKAIYNISGESHINGYFIDQLVRALIFVQAVVVSKSRITEEINIDIRSGKISVYLLNPIGYIRYKFLESFPTMIYKLIISLILGLGLGYAFLGSIDTSFLGIIAGATLLIGGMFIMFFGYMMVGLLGFYTQDADSFRLLYAKLDLFFGGNILPLPFLPMIIQAIAFASPFAYAGYTAGLLFVSFDLSKFTNYLGMQVLWIAIFIGVCNLIYFFGKKKLIANGG